MKKVLIIGLGIGNLYKKVLTEHNNKEQFEVVTIDLYASKNADYLTLDECYVDHTEFDLAIICCPNHYHESYVLGLKDRKMAKTILVEKPGLKNFATWALYTTASAPNKLIMVKNNFYRKQLLDEIKRTIADNYADISEIKIEWLNRDRVPKPGSWFTNKELAWGGVSRDLMPHLLSVYYGLFETTDTPTDQDCIRKYTLEDIDGSEYGDVQKEDAVYNVDDQATVVFSKKIKRKTIPVTLNASWKTGANKSRIGVTIVINDHPIFYDFGLCPEDAYYKMILDTLNMTTKQYNEHKEIDSWIHQILDNYEQD